MGVERVTHAASMGFPPAARGHLPARKKPAVRTRYADVKCTNGTADASPPIRGGKSLNSMFNTILLWVVIIVLVILLWQLFQGTNKTAEEVTFTRFVEQVSS